MGPLTIPMALLLVLGALAGPVLALSGRADLVLDGALAFVAATALLALVYRACEPLEAAARGRRARGGIASGRLYAILFGLLPMLALVGLQLAAVKLLARPAPRLLAGAWFYAVATGPATLLAASASRERRTLWSVRAYAGHIGGWIWLALGGPWAASSVALLALLPAILPVGIGALIALADPRTLRSSRI